MPTELPYVALGEQPNFKNELITFTLKLTNYSNASVTYNAVGNVQTVDYRMRARVLPGALITITPSNVTVPPNSATFVTVTIDARNCNQSPYNFYGYILDYYVNYIEGFVKFVPVDTSIPEVHIPYMGILGNWNQFTIENAWDFNPVIDPPADDPYNLIWWWFGEDYIDTWPETTDGYHWNLTGIDFYGNLDRNAIAFNSNIEYLEANFGLLRNAQNVTIEIRDSSGNLVKTIDSVEWMYKDPYYSLGAWYWYYSNPWTGEPFWWDGTNESGNVVPDGKYKLVIKATPQKMFNKANYDSPHVVELPVSLDRVAPTTSWTKTVNSDGSVTVSWTALDPQPSSGIWGYELIWGGGGNIKFVSPTTNSYTIPAGNYTEDLIVFAIDNAFNIGFGSAVALSVQPQKISVAPFQTASATLTATGGAGGYNYYLVKAAPTPVGKYILSGNKFSFTPLPQDEMKTFVFTFKVIDNLGRESSATLTVNVDKLSDTTPPTLTLPTINGVNLDTPNATLWISEGTLTFTVSATDESGIARMIVKVNGIVQIDKDNLDPTIYLFEGTNIVEISVYDTVGNYVTKSFKVVKDTTPPTIILTSDIPQTVTSSTLTLKGVVLDQVSGVKSFKVNGTDVPLTLEGNFEKTIQLSQGVNTITLTAEDKLGNTSTKTITVNAQSTTQRTRIITLQVNSPYLTIDFTTTKAIDSQGSKPIIKNGRTLIPIRTLIESLGGKVTWFDKEKKVLIELNGHSVTLFIGKTTALVDGSKATLDVAPEIINGRTYLPLRFISESLGMVVDWDAKTQTITIYYIP
ncbi:MAG: stalk domain-containing protein [Candidatus Parvarchaeota archaeon]|nr:stalk domain-containing protein [Candidatus Jingweiarchaeum tengchongense]